MAKIFNHLVTESLERFFSLERPDSEDILRIFLADFLTGTQASCESPAKLTCTSLLVLLQNMLPEILQTNSLTQH